MVRNNGVGDDLHPAKLGDLVDLSAENLLGGIIGRPHPFTVRVMQ